MHAVLDVSSVVVVGDTVPLPKAILDQKLALLRKTFEEYVARLIPIQDDIQFARTRAYADLTLELTEYRAKIEGCCKELLLIARGDVQPYSEVFTSVANVKKLEVELELLLMKIIELQKRASSSVYRNQKLLREGIVEVFPVPAIVPINPSYRFWKNVPYNMQYSYSAPNVLGGGWYQQTGYLGNELEKIGQPVAELLHQLDERLIDYSSWNEPLEALNVRVQGLFTMYMSLEGDLNAPRDALSPFVDEYISGLEYAFKETFDKLELLQKCSLMPLRDMVATLKDVNAYSLMPHVLGIHFDVLKFLQVVSRLKDIAAKLPERPSSFSEQFAVRFYESLQVIQYNAARHFLELNENEKEVPEKVFANQHVKPDTALAYTLKRMLYAVYLAPESDPDICLELVLEVIPDILKGFDSLKGLHASYLAKRRASPEAIAAAGRFVHELYTVEMSVYTYAKFWQRFFETPELSTTKNLKAELVRHLEIIAKRYRYSIHDRQVLKLQDNIDRLIATCLAPGRDDTRENARKGTCNSLLFRLLGCALFASDTAARAQAQGHIARIIEDAQFENVLIDISPDVRELLYKLIITKCTLLPQSTLGQVELRLLVDGPIDQFFSQTTFNLESLDLHLALFRLITVEARHSGVRPALERFKKVYRHQFERWLHGFNLAKLAHIVPQCPIVYEEAAIRHALESIPPYTAKLDSTLWDTVLGKEFGDAEHKAGIALRAQAYLLSYMPESINSKQLDVELDLFLESLRKDPACKFILDFFVRSYENRGLLQSYDLQFRQYRCDTLFKEASDVVASILNALKEPYDVYYYAKAWQQGIDFCRQAGQEGVDQQQHEALTRFIFSRLEALSKKTGFILLENEERYSRIVQKAEADCTPKVLFRLLATCLFGVDPHEVQEAHMQLTKFLELGDISLIPAPLMSLIYENTAEKTLKGDFEVGKREKYLFFGGPVTRIITTNEMSLSDIKIIHALHCLYLDERIAPIVHPKPFTALLLKSRVNLDEFFLWGKLIGAN